jgi:hypothetical protein
MSNHNYVSFVILVFIPNHSLRHFLGTSTAKAYHMSATAYIHTSFPFIAPAAASFEACVAL